MAKINTLKTIEQIRGHINSRYDMTAEDISAIYNSSREPFDMMCKSFTFGYAQGMKAARKEIVA